MRQQIHEEQVPGKTVENLDISYGRVVITFTDGTFVNFIATADDDGQAYMDDEEVERREMLGGPFLSLGIITEEEVQQIGREAAESARAADRADYERLCKK